MEALKLFVNGQSQAVRSPKAFRFAGDEICARSEYKWIYNLLPHFILPPLPKASFWS